MSLIFVVLYVLSCITKLWGSFYVLMLGRLLGGISTSLLFSVFEAWMVSEHYSRGFPSELLAETFSWATFGNGIVAILSGIMANSVVDMTDSYVAPFMLAIVFLVSGGVLVQLTWTENYGKKDTGAVKITAGSMTESLRSGMRTVLADPSIFAVGSIVALFEGSMYTFVFMWGPVLEESFQDRLPFGWIFAAFMVCIMIG
jgi:hypothetical protein